MMNRLLETAKKWVENGFSVIPLFYQSKRSMIKWESYQTKLPSNLELQQWFPSAIRNIGLITGNGLVVIDFDIQEVFDYWFSLYPLDTYMVKTRRGMHVYLYTEQLAANYHSPLLDIKAERGYVLIPPSIHPSGYEYQVYSQSSILCIANLLDVLPREFTPEPEKTAAPPFTEPQPICNDPWAIADSATSFEMGIVDRIRREISLLSMMRGAEPSSVDGRWYRALCPFHDDHTPSFWIDLQRGMCGCRKCNIKEMDVIDLYSRLHRVSIQGAISDLGKLI